MIAYSIRRSLFLYGIVVTVGLIKYSQHFINIDCQESETIVLSPGFPLSQEDQMPGHNVRAKIGSTSIAINICKCKYVQIAAEKYKILIMYMYKKYYARKEEFSCTTDFVSSLRMRWKPFTNMQQDVSMSCGFLFLYVYNARFFIITYRTRYIFSDLDLSMADSAQAQFTL